MNRTNKRPAIKNIDTTMKAYSKGLTECLNYMEIANHFYFDPLKANIEKDRERIKLTAAINLQKSFCF